MSGTTKSPYVDLVTDSTGTVTVKHVAGYLGKARVKADSIGATGQAASKIDTVSYAVPGLVNLQSAVLALVNKVYWIGGNNDHVQGSNFYVQDSVKTLFQPIADSMVKTVNGQPLYLQFNDASLPNGGTFIVYPGNQVRLRGSLLWCGPLRARHGTRPGRRLVF